MRKIGAKYIYDGRSSVPMMDSFVEIDESEGNKVIRIGKISKDDTFDEYFDGAIVPGFVNSHCHLELSYLKGKFSKGTGMAGFIDQINAMRDTSSRKERMDDARKWLDIMWERGISAMADISNCNESFGAKAVSPMYTRTFLEVFGTEPQDCDRIIQSVKALQVEASEVGLDAAPTPHACYTMSTKLLEEVSALALQSGYLSYHSEESQEEEDMMMYGRGPMYDNRKRAGMTMPPVTGTSSLEYFLERLKAVSQVPVDGHILLVHEVCMTECGVEAAKKTLAHPYIALCPCSNIFIHNTLPPVDMLRSCGISLTVGTDSLSSNDDLDMIRELYCLQENFVGIPLGQMIRWATYNGANFLGKSDMLGSISKGLTPGLVFIDHMSEEGKLTSASKSKRII